MFKVDEEINFKKVSLLLKNKSEGKNILYSIKNGKPIYSQILILLTEMINNDKKTVTLEEIRRYLGVSNNFIDYPLSKFSIEGLITIRKSLKRKIVFISEKNKKVINSLCKKL